MRADAGKMLSALGLTVHPFINGSEAWHYLQKAKHTFKNKPDIIFSDINMPEMDGLQLLEKVRSDTQYAKIPFVVLTANKEELLRITALCLNVTAFCIKPPDPNQVQQLLKKLF